MFLEDFPKEDVISYQGQEIGAEVIFPADAVAQEAVKACYRLLVAVTYHPETIAGAMIEVGEEILGSFSGAEVGGKG